MNEKLKKELAIKKEYELKYIPHTKLIELNLENIQKIETMLRYNPDYPQFINFSDYRNDKVINKIWNDVKNEYLENKKLQENDSELKFIYPSFYYIFALMLEKKTNNLIQELYQYYIEAILRKINAENHTHTSNSDITAITQNICKDFPNIDELLEALIEPLKDDCQYQLIRCIASEVNKRHNFSLATKFCHYLNFYIYFETGHADLYSIYDGVVNDNLHLYYNYYVLKEEKNLNQPIINYKYKYKSNDLKKLSNLAALDFLIDIYKTYQNIIAKIIQECGLSRNGFDHIVWYTNKSKEYLK